MIEAYVVWIDLFERHSKIVENNELQVWLYNNDYAQKIETCEFFKIRVVDLKTT